ncbi:ACP phosphodiesterase [Thermoleptolyngbya sichuanensis XZ-Cy5]|uniref:acyl carrier protein phosphodiesterase n=1 Tax=Thermoleptolyngbya sichuanensis TaxID=2885951 RepID=UPI00240E60A8|nr:ACP phosphodiesterase [Thermoleptolyngbya sichuanensis]MDG2618211.1 ACP phosphodiesterase [Thermoleptolyngbya sichuanensis XZ-Cy5]
MNYLAHLLLSEPDLLARLGNLAGDFLKGADVRSLHPTIQRGIALHRQIDTYTDCHPIVRQSKARVEPPYCRLAGVLVDVFYDHFLAVHWQTYGVGTLEEFVQGVYADLQHHQALLPPSLQRALPFMVTGDWLTAYRQVSGIEMILERMAARSRRSPLLASSICVLHHHYSALEQEFHQFFPALKVYVYNQVAILVAKGSGF